MDVDTSAHLKQSQSVEEPSSNTLEKRVTRLEGEASKMRTYMEGMSECWNQPRLLFKEALGGDQVVDPKGQPIETKWIMESLGEYRDVDYPRGIKGKGEWSESSKTRRELGLNVYYPRKVKN
ncbi:hypothetical protein RND71_008231 [Anisodus tanguticus]|uniref:Uncharacterized protein n=1 Tax=Anisodus tanguticus TaxID=243964 RepID=A0AAE1VKU2_9SOLA|nr:hypothetical protein RND71_008231 [Anisodus tanguticus]